MHQDLYKIHSNSAENNVHTAIPIYIYTLFFQTLNIFYMQSSTFEIMEIHKWSRDMSLLQGIYT